ncbi:mfs transporter [Diplodia corticola]|uniref:Mfs transporter n=1 Tax=Diplodia corticola TaxID=236234 RepID=A0A1J9R8J9_9PEZI|nr:mfs transporter [Diplodia corticola]OJD36904.1 mfs transporter [Diplodia corticola]
MGNDAERSEVVAAATVAEPAITNGSVVVEQDTSATPPDGGYGWVCVGCVFMLNACTWGIAATYGVFLSHYLSTDAHPGATALDYAFIGGLQFGCALALASPITIITRVLDSIHIPMLAGVLIQTAGYLLASFADRTQIWQLYLTQGVLVGAGIGLAYLPSAAVTSQWFARRRSLANGIVSAGSGVGGIAFSLASSRVMSMTTTGGDGVAWALRTLAIASAAVNLAAVALVRGRDRQLRPTARGFDAALLARPDVALLLAWAFCSMLGYMTLLYSLSAYVRDAAPSSAARADAVTAWLNLGTAVGRPALGWASDRWGRLEVAGAATAACAVLVFAVWLPVSEAEGGDGAKYGVVVGFAVVSGAVLGVLWMVGAAAVFFFFWSFFFFFLSSLFLFVFLLL